MLFPPARDPALDPAPRRLHLRTLRVAWGQIAAIVLIASLVAWLSRFWPPVPWNAIIWIGSSVAIPVFASKRLTGLFVAPLLALIFVAALVGNEVVAHLVFATCLYD